MGWFLLPIGAIAILWAFVLCIAAFNCKIPRKLKRAEKAIIRSVERKYDAPIYYVVSMAVLGISFAGILVKMLGAHISFLPFCILYGAGLLLASMLCGHSIWSARHRKQTKIATTQNSQSQNQDA
ncbi:MAG: hypothetical protein KAX20_06345 [Candidatus Omnitrophica bacterium]|nr:hypothetical protein [Candidatus Omnitrophota bacterium]